jgi:hypothetical protein
MTSFKTLKRRRKKKKERRREKEEERKKKGYPKARITAVPESVSENWAKIGDRLIDSNRCRSRLRGTYMIKVLK